MAATQTRPVPHRSSMLLRKQPPPILAPEAAFGKRMTTPLISHTKPRPDALSSHPTSNAITSTYPTAKSLAPTVNPATKSAASKSTASDSTASRDQHLSRRSSRNLLGLFQRSSKSPVEPFFPLSPKPSEAVPASAPTQTATTQLHNERASEQPQTLRTTAGNPEIANERTERSSRTLQWDSLPLSSAYTLAIRHATLLSPTISADAVMRAHRRLEQEQKAELEVNNEKRAETRDDVQKSRPTGAQRPRPNSLQLTWTTKIYVLAAAGNLIQYAGTGQPDRVPERTMQLGKESAAFASDMIPGKHWVLHVSQRFDDDGTGMGSRDGLSMLSRLGLNGRSRRSVPNLLLVMPCAEDMNNWLVAIRKEIQGLGGMSYKPDVQPRKTSEEQKERMRRRQARHFVVGDQNHTPGDFALAEHKAAILRQNASIDDSMSAAPTLADEPIHSDSKRWSQPPRITTELSLPPITGFDSSTTLALSERCNASFAPSTTRSDKTLSDDLDRAVRPTIVENGTSRPVSTSKTSEERSDSPPNFSVPFSSNRFSQSYKTSSTLSPPPSSGEESTADELGSRPSSFLCDLPSSLSTHGSSSRKVSWADKPVPPLPIKLPDAEPHLPEIVALTPARSEVPVRFSSLEHSYGLLPWTLTHDGPDDDVIVAHGPESDAAILDVSPQKSTKRWSRRSSAKDLSTSCKQLDLTKTPKLPLPSTQTQMQAPTADLSSAPAPKAMSSYSLAPTMTSLPPHNPITPAVSSPASVAKATTVTAAHLRRPSNGLGDVKLSTSPRTSISGTEQPKLRRPQSLQIRQSNTKSNLRHAQSSSVSLNASHHQSLSSLHSSYQQPLSTLHASHHRSLISLTEAERKMLRSARTSIHGPPTLPPPSVPLPQLPG